MSSDDNYEQVHLNLCLVTPHGDMNLGQLLLRPLFNAWQHQAITWTNVD